MVSSRLQVLALGAAWVFILPPRLAAQSRASRLVDAAFAQFQAHNLDSAEALLHPVLDSQGKATPVERGAALLLFGIIDFYRGRDSAVAGDFRASLELTLALKGDWLVRLDSSLAAIWRRERARALCGALGRDSVPLAVRDDAAVVTEKPRLLKGPSLAYPERLRRAGVTGRVLVGAVLDTTGRAESGSIKIIDTPHEDFSREARRYVQRAVFQPARIGDRPTRVCVQIPIDFKISGRP